MRLQIVSFRPPSGWLERESIREPVRLGHRVFLTGVLEESEIERAVAVLSAFRATMDRHGVAHYRAIATSAVREAQNRDLFLDRVANVARIELEPISGAEEARLLTVGVARHVDLGRRCALLVDIGGGSVELALVRDGAAVFTQSHRLGAVRLAELFLDGPRSAEEKAALLEEYLDRMLAETVATIRKLRPELLVAVGGNAEALARIAAREGDTDDEIVPGGVLEGLAEELAALDPARRARRFDLRPDRVDTIVPAAALLRFLVDRLDLAEILVSRIGIRDGVLAELADRVAGRADPEQAERGVLAEAERLGEHYRFDSAHAAQVRRLALSLFDALRPQHRLGARDRLLLGVAATLHDIGEFVGYAHHHKHGYYLVSNAELGGLSTEELRLVAVVVRYHRRALPSDRHDEYGRLSRDDRRRVSRLAAILRLADSLDREHRQKVVGLNATLRRGALELATAARGDLMLERWAVENKGAMFREVYGLEVRLLDEGARPRPKRPRKAAPKARPRGKPRAKARTKPRARARR